MDSLDGRVSFIGPLFSESRLGDVVAGNPGHQSCLLLSVAVSESEGNHVEATGNIIQFPSVYSHEIRHEPPAQSFSLMLSRHKRS